MVVETRVTALTDYPLLFRDYVVKSVAQLRARLGEAGRALSAADQELALHALSFALKLPEAWPESRGLLLAIAPKMEQAGCRDEWLPFLNQGLAQSQALADPETAAALRFHLGLLYQLQGYYAKAREYLTASAQGYEALQLSAQQAQALHRLAQVARLERDYHQARQLVGQALPLLAPNEPERAFGYLVLGTIALDQRAWTEAVAQFEQALHLWAAGDDRRMIGRSLMSLGAALRPLERYSEAIAAYRRAIAIFEGIQDPLYAAIVRMNLGNVYLAERQPELALANYQPALPTFRRLQDRLHLSHVYHNIGMARRQLGHWAAAIEAFQASLGWQERVGNVGWQIDTLDELGLTYLDQGDLSRAGATFAEALERLAGLKGEAVYDHYDRRLAEHYQQVLALQGDESKA